MKVARWLANDRVVLRTAIVVGLVVRLVVFWQTTSLGARILDEQDYAHLASSLVQGRGFASTTGAPTSIRPPAYPAVVAAIWSVAGDGNFQAVRAVQIILALITTWLVFGLGRALFDRRVGRYAAAAFFLYPSLIFLNALILTETLFTLLLVLFIVLGVKLIQAPKASVAIMCGVSLGLATLTRSILWPSPLLLCPLLAIVLRGSIKTRLALPALVLVGFAVVIAPWAIRNTRLQGVPTIVDTMGGMNLRMGNYEFTPDDRMWDAVSLTGEKNWAHGIDADFPLAPPTEGQKDKWAQRKAIAYIAQHPGLTMHRAVIKFADFWGLEREFLAGVDKGMFAVPLWLAAPIAIAMVLAYAIVAVAGVAGLWLTPASARLHAFVLLPVVLIVGLHTVVFGHSRYHIPLVPVLAIYAAALATQPVSRFVLARAGAAISVVMLLGIWTRQIVVVDAERLSALWAWFRKP